MITAFETSSYISYIQNLYLYTQGKEAFLCTNNIIHAITIYIVFYTTNNQ